jgi:uncharacterized protein YecT (DUF1311 family)
MDIAEKLRMKTVFLITFLSLCCFVCGASAKTFEYKDVGDFPLLHECSTVEEFEKNYGDYTQSCLDNSYGGSRGIPCFISYEMWDRELNYYYQRLASVLDKEGRTALKESQKAWLKERDLSIEFNTLLLNNKYSARPGTMFLLMRAGDAEDLSDAMVKQRALQLKKWLEFCSKD